MIASNRKRVYFNENAPLTLGLTTNYLELFIVFVTIHSINITAIVNNNNVKPIPEKTIKIK